MDYLKKSEELTEQLTIIRGYLHSHPELGNTEFLTSEFLEKELLKMGLEVKRILGTALVATLHGKGKNTGRKVALRADMDALPIEEKTVCPFKSSTPGIMHACGHDIHMTAALGTAMLLLQCKENINGDVIFLFEPDEEGRGGARRMIDAGVLDGVSAVFGGHVEPGLPLGTVGIKYGKFYAASDVMTIRIHGRSCHGATPEKGADALLAASEMALELTRIKPSSGDKAVLSIGQIKSGTSCNVIADEAELKGIVRTLGNDDRLEMRELISSAVNEISEKNKVTSDLELSYSYGGVVNTQAETALMEECARNELGHDKVTLLEEPTMTTEDFGYFIDACSGSFCHIGAGCTEPLHSPYFLPDIKAAVTAAAVYAETIVEYLK